MGPFTSASGHQANGHRAGSQTDANAIGHGSCCEERGTGGVRRREVSPTSQPAENSQSPIVNQTGTFFRLVSSFMLGKRQHLISKPGRGDFEKI